jgi:SWI/SNF-related matrix-associated actin-dependent regulator 1 of chromatin subfamily A
VLEYNRFSHKLEYNGCRNTAELHHLLKNKIMIRRLKAEVLSELPEKQRQIIELETTKSCVKEIKELLSSNQIPLDVLRNNDRLLEMGETGSGFSPLLRCYLLTGLAKLDGVKDYLSSLLDNDVKILLFAHHKIVMDGLEEHLQKLNVQHIKIDGNTNNDVRKKYVKGFQEDSSYRVALLSITAAGCGLTLTAASTVVFAELHWTPAVLVQAEDRVHRIGQKSCVNVHYLVGEGTLDHILLKQLQRKLETVGDILNGNKQNLEAESLQRGRIGRFSQSRLESVQGERTQQKTLMDWVKKEKNTIKSEGTDSDIDIDECDQAFDSELEKLIQEKEK